MDLKSEEEIINLLANDSETFHSLCRLCLMHNNDNKIIFDTEESTVLLDKIFKCTTVELIHYKHLPNTICNMCYNKIETFYQFRNTSLYANKILTKIQNTFVNTNKHDIISVGNDSNNKDSVIVTDFKEDITIKSEENEFLTIPNRKLVKKRKNKDFQRILGDEKREKRLETIIIETDKSLRENERLKLFICDICRKQLKSKKSLENHIKNVHNESRMNKDVGSISGYGSYRRYHCTECNYDTKYKIDLIIHIRRHTGEKPYKCSICTKCFTQQSTLNNHLKTHSDIMYFTCPHCGKQFKYKYKFEKHKNSHTQDKRYFCTICSRGLKSPKILEEHMNRHFNIKNYNCETCGSTFVTFSEMSIHSRIHGTEKKFKCHLCEYKTFVKASLEKHLRRHTGERPYICEICQWKCYTQGELKVHSRTHTKEKNYTCPVCTTSFKTSSALNKHVIRTHGIKYKWSDHKDRRIIK